MLTDNNRKATILAYYFSKFDRDAMKALGYSTLTEAFGDLSLKFGKDNHRSKPIIQLDLDGSFVNRWENARDIERTIGIDYRYVSRCCNHKCKTAHSYIFMFEEEYYEQMGKVKN